MLVQKQAVRSTPFYHISKGENLMTRIRNAFFLFIGAALVAVTTFTFGNLLNWWTKDLLYFGAIALSTWATVLYFNIQLNKLELKHKIKVPEVRLPRVQVPEDLEDDVDALMNGRPNWPTFSVLLTITAMFVFTWQLISRNKLTADWYGFNVFLVSILVAGLVVWLTSRTPWFQDKSFETPWWVFVIPLGAIVIATSLGLYYTEPIEFGGDTPAQIAQRGQEYNYDQTRAGRSSSWININTYRGSSSSGSSDFDFDCDGKGCAYAILLVLLIVVVLMLIIGSAMIPHFWVFAGILFLAFMFMIAVHNLRYNPSFYRRRYSW